MPKCWPARLVCPFPAGQASRKSPRVEKVRVWFAPEVAAEIRERKWLAGQEVVEGEGGVVLSGEVAGLAEVERWVLSYGPAAKVLEPNAWRERVAKKLRDGAAGYESVPVATPSRKSR